jgi:hypothetical protein
MLAYILTTKLEGIVNKAGRHCAMVNLYHSCMQIIVGPIATAGETDIAMMSGDGVWRRCHPILASFVGDYPEQVLVMCTYTNRCLKCLVPPDQLGTYARFPACNYDQAIDAYLLADGNAHAFHLACHEAGQKPVFHPFWESLPLCNIFVSITPDVLHQLLQGVLKHLIAWLISTSSVNWEVFRNRSQTVSEHLKPNKGILFQICCYIWYIYIEKKFKSLTNEGLSEQSYRCFGSVEINVRCRSLPPNHHSTFAKGISGLCRVTRKEHKNICRILLGLVVDLPVPGGTYHHRSLQWFARC